MLDPGFQLRAEPADMSFHYGEGVFGPVPEKRRLDDIRGSLLDPECDGPETVYSIVMDVGKLEHQSELQRRMLLFGAVTYASGRLGDEPVRSQGHVHRVSDHSGWSPPELYEIWSGSAYICMQEHAADDPGRCFAVYAQPGDRVLVPPGWAHATISANPQEPLTFGAWCDREYGFEYDEVRRRRGLAWYPILREDGEIRWKRNDQYAHGAELVVKEPRTYEQFGLRPGIAIYRQFEDDPESMQFISKPQLKEACWHSFIP